MTERLFKTTSQADSNSILRDLISITLTLLASVGFALVIILFVFRSYEVSGISMQTTLVNKDKLIVLKVPRTWAAVTGHQYVPKRGDIIIFNQPNLIACGQDESKQLVKRVIGLPGDRIMVHDGAYTIYNSRHPNGFDPDITLGYFKGRSIPITTGNLDITLAANQLFVSGDNRLHSCDSRSFGPITTSQVIGEVIVRVDPISSMQLF